MTHGITESPTEGSSEQGQRPALSRLPSLTGLRFPAAFLVFLSHVGLALPQLRLLKSDGAASDLAKFTENAGALGVAFFFVLSGFVLTWSARTKDTAPAFWRRRFVKIYPNYVLAWALALILFASTYTPTRVAIANVLMVQVWKPDFAYMYSVNPVSWSLACELIFYLCFPLLHRLFVRIRDEHLKYWIAGVTAAIILTPWFTYTFLPGNGTQMTSDQTASAGDASVTQYWVAVFLPPVRLLDFALGMLVAHAVMRGRWRNIGLIWSTFLVAVSWYVSQNVDMLYAKRSVSIIPIALLIAAAATKDVKGEFTVFRNRTMVWLGEVSFAFYMCHFLVLQYGRKLLGHDLYSIPQTIGLEIMLTAIAVLFSWMVYAVLERPVYRLFATSRKARAERAGATA
ncbi:MULTISPECIES: acyltransferase [unclassified Streptomyces]|uniref:Acyltransferase n=1 Tax=Streptomyces sp. NBC_00060 TaxID=2975636 RepID=A0AAU2HCQ9_9ACTN